MSNPPPTTLIGYGTKWRERARSERTGGTFNVVYEVPLYRTWYQVPGMYYTSSTDRVGRIGGLGVKVQTREAADQKIYGTRRRTCTRVPTGTRYLD